VQTYAADAAIAVTAGEDRGDVDTDITEDQRALLEVSSRFMEQTCSLEVLRDTARRDGAFDAAYRRQAAELGWFSMLVPEALGGGCVSGNGVADAALLAYRRGALLQPGPFVGTNVVADAVAAGGTGELRAAVLEGLVCGEAPGSWAVASAGDNRPDAGVTARPDGTGGYVLDGAKTAVQDVEAGSWLLVTARGDAGPVSVVVGAGAPGVTVTALESLDLTRRFAEVRFDSVAVPATHVLDAAAAPLQRQLAVAALLTAAESVGTMDRELEVTVQYAKDRIAFGRPIGSFQAIKHLLADTSLAVEMGKAVVTAAAASLGGDDGYGLQAASMAKALVGEAAVELAQNCFQVFGGIGYTWEHDQHLYLRRLTTDAGLFGDASWHREHLCQLSGLEGAGIEGAR
jgi:alkylation response protein AidB-like acyl-CoA dehydrogenase